MPKLTKKTVEEIRPDPDRDITVWDSALPGFGVRVWPSGKRVYILKYRNNQGRQRKATIGQHGVALTAVQARSKALKWLGEVEEGGDPAAEKIVARRGSTVNDLAQRYLEEHAQARKKASSIRSDRVLLRLHILPALGRLKVGAVTRDDVSRLHHAMRNTPGSANRTLALMGKMFSLAEKWELRPNGSNPCRHVDKYPEHKRERFLSDAELTRLAEVLAEAERTGTELASVVAAIHLLLLTGCRLSEILTLRWDYVDLNQRRLNLPDSKTGKKVVYLPEPAVEVLVQLPRDQSGWVIPGAKPGGHLINLQKPWRRIRLRAGLNDVRLHDLRHSFASMAAASGLSLPIIGALLGHSQPQTTDRYAHLVGDTMQEAANKVGQHFTAAIKNNATKEATKPDQGKARAVKAD